MNNIIYNYLIKNFLKTFFLTLGIIYCFGLILNLFEEIEFFKNLDVNIVTPLLMSSFYVPSLVIKILPFIIFISSMWFMLTTRNNKDLLMLKVFGYSNLKIFLILATTSFFIGWFVLIVFTPISSIMTKYYEKTKSNYSRDIDHLISFNKNGLWVKENLGNETRIISAAKPEGKTLIDVTIIYLDKNFQLKEKINSKTADINEKKWLLNDVTIFKNNSGMLVAEKTKNFLIETNYDYEKITNLFRNFDTMSFLELILDYKKLLNNGYNKSFLSQNLHTMLSLPFFLFMMTALATILTFNTLKRSNSSSFIVVGLLVSILVFYFKVYLLPWDKLTEFL